MPSVSASPRRLNRCKSSNSRQPNPKEPREHAILEGSNLSSSKPVVRQCHRVVAARLLGGRSFSSDINPRLPSGVLTPEASRSISPSALWRPFQNARLAFFVLTLAACLLFSGAASARRKPIPPNGAHSGPHVTSELTGSVPLHDGERVRLAADLGSVIVHTQDGAKLDYHVHLEADASQKDAQQLLKSFTISTRQAPDEVLLTAKTSQRRSTGRLWATIELDVPKNVSLDVSTGGGDIQTADISGRVTLSTGGGNITAGDIGGPARLDTGGGNIVAKNVAGELAGTTGGGHITVGSVAGNATLHTGGGHIRVGSVQGMARLDTAGGNITLEHSGGELTADTGGGEIEVGEAAGLVRAKTGGGGIRVVRMFGPTDLETSGGSIYLTQVDSAVKASTDDGGITAWFVAPAKAPGICELESSSGDIVVHLPRELAVTIDAQVEKGNEHRMIVDPAFPLKVSYEDSAKGARTVRAEGALNGGGEVLRLRTVAGNIQFVLSDAGKQAQIYQQQMQQLKQQTQAPASPQAGAQSSAPPGNGPGDPTQGTGATPRQ